MTPNTGVARSNSCRRPPIISNDLLVLQISSLLSCEITVQPLSRVRLISGSECRCNLTEVITFFGGKTWLLKRRVFLNKEKDLLNVLDLKMSQTCYFQHLVYRHSAGQQTAPVHHRTDRSKCPLMVTFSQHNPNRPAALCTESSYRYRSFWPQGRRSFPLRHKPSALLPVLGS